jgi:hypothetical protein
MRQQFLHAASALREGTALAEIGEELQDKASAMRKYRRQSLWLLVPFVAPAVAIRSPGRER